MTTPATRKPTFAKTIQLNKVTLKDLTPVGKDANVKGGISVVVPPPRVTAGC